MRTLSRRRAQRDQGGHLVLGRHVDNAVGIDVKRDLDLRHAPRRRGQALQLKLAEHLVVAGHLALALQHLDPDLLAREQVSPRV